MRVGICGAGTMGRGIAVACLQAGLQVLLYDIRSEVLQKASQAIAQLLRTAHERGKLAESPRTHSSGCAQSQRLLSSSDATSSWRRS
jgi:3-hydroxyacyl-CoA dehydrogenase